MNSSTHTASIPPAWKATRLGNILRRVRRPVDVKSGETYREIGIYSHGRGIFHKEERSGASLGSKRVFWVQPDCFVVNIVFAWEQAVAQTTDAENGMIASHRFPMYKPVQGKLDLDYLVYYFKTSRGRYLLSLASPGGAGRNKTLGQQAFLDLEIPLPPFPEQCKIADILRIWDKAIALTEQLFEAEQQRKKGLMQQLLTGHQTLDTFESQAWQRVRLQDIALVNPKKPNDLCANTTVSFVTMSDVSETAQIVGKQNQPYSEVRTGYTSFQDNDVLVAKITPCFENGKGALVQNLTNGVGFGSTEFHVLRADTTQALPEFIYYHTISDEFRGRGRASMVGSAGQKRVRTHFVKSYSLMLPPLHEQRRISDILRACDTEISLLAQKRDALERQKKGLMQQLLTGRVRVKI